MKNKLSGKTTAAVQIDPPEGELMNKTIEFLDSIDFVWNAPVPEEVTERIKRSFLDYLAVTCAGASFQKDKLDRYSEFAEPEPGRFRAIGTGRDLALKEAVFLNGLNAHALDYDDGTNSGIIHLGSPIFSLLIPLAQRYGFSLKKMLRAAVTGYEASYTMAISIQPGHKSIGYHATGTCGTLGATLSAAYMTGSDRKEINRAFACACIASSGVLKALDEGSELKPYNVAKTSLLSLTALQLAKSGFNGPADPLGGRGFLKMMTGNEDTELKPVLLDGRYAVMRTYTKPYASCRYTHPSVEAAIRLRYRVKDTDDIEEVRILTYGLAVAGHDHKDIPGSYSAKMSIPYAVAAGLMYGKAGLAEFSEETVGGKQIKELMEKIKVSADEGLSRAFPATQTAVVTLRTRNGEYTERVDFPKGEPENPLTEAEFRDRYYGLMDYAGVKRSVSKELYDSVITGDPDVDTLVKGL